MKKDIFAQRVKHFHKTFGHPIGQNPTLIEKERALLRISLLQEELDELTEAVSQDNMVEVCDALCDLQYILSGTIIEYGLGDIFPFMFDEVHNSNMSKLCKTEEEAADTVLEYLNDGVKSKYEKIGDYYAVYRLEDNKILKSINFTRPDLKKFIKNL